MEIGSNFLSIPIIRLDKINDVFDSFQYFWQDCDIFEVQLINESVLEKFHRDHDQYARRPLKVTNQGSAKPYLKPATPILVTDVTVTTSKY